MTAPVFIMEESLCPMKSYFEMGKNGLTIIHNRLSLIFFIPSIVNVKMVDGIVMMNQLYPVLVPLLALRMWKHSMVLCSLLNQAIIY
jgi:hypothetical protein